MICADNDRRVVAPVTARAHRKSSHSLSQRWRLRGLYCQARGLVALAPSMSDSSITSFEMHRPLLFGIAYRMLGSVADAHDMVQETYLRWRRANDEEIRSPRAWLTTAVTRLCINHLQLARVQRETYVGPWLPEPIVDEASANPAEAAALADTLSLALLVVLETLNPTERAVFILREAFDCAFSDIARIVDKSEANCRQILARARQHIDSRQPRFHASPQDAEKVLAPFLAALKAGDLQGMLASLADHVVLTADAGDKPGALRLPLRGAQPVAQAMLNAVRKHGTTGELRPASINRLPGFVRLDDGQARAVLAFGIAGGRIHAVFVISNPNKLRHLTQP